MISENHQILKKALFLGGNVALVGVGPLDSDDFSLQSGRWGNHNSEPVGLALLFTSVHCFQNYMPRPRLNSLKQPKESN